MNVSKKETARECTLSRPPRQFYQFPLLFFLVPRSALGHFCYCLAPDQMSALNPIKLYHTAGCRSTRIVWLYLELRKAYADLPEVIPELELNMFRNIAAFRNEKPKWYLRIKPDGKVPFLVDDNTNCSLFESGAIATYLLEMYDPENRLLGADPQSKAKFYQFAHYSTGTVDNLTSTSQPWQRAINLSSKEPPNLTVTIDPIKKLQWTEVSAQIFATQIEQTGGPYLMGESWSAVDVFFGFNTRSLEQKMIQQTGESWIDRERYPMIGEYFDLVSAREPFMMAWGEPTEWGSASFDAHVTIIDINQDSEGDSVDQQEGGGGSNES